MNILKSDRKLIALAPMAGFTDSAFRKLCKEYGADLVYTEMISASGIVYERKNKKSAKSLNLAKFEESERPIIVQIFGKDPKIMAEAAKIILDQYDPEGIDVNMGCPARKIVADFNGASLMKDIKLAGQIIKEVRQVTRDKILSVKTRLGWDNKKDIFSFSKMVEDEGADLIAIHCRTKVQGFSGKPDWEIISNLKLKIPIMANGGIKNQKDAKICLEKSKADGILIGQGALGRPWIFSEIKNKKDQNLSLSKTVEIALRHLSLFEGNFIETRKQLLFYFKGFANCSKIRAEICKCENKEDFLKILKANDCDDKF